MTTPVAPYLYTEARLDIEPTYPNSTLHISTESASLFSGRKRPRLDDGDADKDEDSYARRHVATEGSIFFRRKNKSPRSFLWRVLEDRKLLEIQSVDLVQSRRNTQESVLSFALTFANPIRPNGVAFADPEERDSLDIFVLTEKNELYTFTLRKDILLKSSVPSSADFDTSSCYKCFTPSSFSFRHPYKLVATSSLELLISLHDGGLLRLERKAGENGSLWRETFFSEGGWSSSFRGLIPWKGHHTIRHNNMDLEPSTAAAIAQSPDTNHVFTLSLDHTLKAWNTKTGKTGVTTDLLGENDKDVHSASQYLMHPDHNTCLEILEVDGSPDGDMYYLAVNSPKDHQFKFWAIRDADSVAHGIRDVQPDVKMIPPLDALMNTSVAQLVDFRIQPGEGWRNTQIWIRARAGKVCRIFTLSFDLLASPDDLEDAWRNNWVAIDEGSLSIDSLMDSSQFPGDINMQPLLDDPSSPTDRWLDFLFYPGRFSSAMLESALHIYKTGLKVLTESSRAGKDKPLKERMCTAISARIKIDRASNGQLDFERYQSEIAAQWRMFFGLIRRLQEKRADSLSLVFDGEAGLPWSVRADHVSPIRSCSELEVLRLNEEIFITQEEHVIVNSLPLANSLPDDNSVPVARLLAGARTFRRGLSAYFRSSFDVASAANAARVGIDGSPNGVTNKHDQHVQELYDICGFHSEVSDDDFNKLTDSMQDLGGLGELDNDLFLAALDRLTETERGVDDEQALTRYGDKTTIRGAQETLILTYEIIMDLLALVVFMAGDLESDELSEHFDASELYEQLMTKLREHQVLLWLASNVRQERTKRTKLVADSIDSSKIPVQPTLTVFESIFIGDWQSLRFPSESMPSLITYWCRAWTYGANLMTSYNGVVMHVMGNLLKHENYDLATDFVRFLPDGPWASYLRGRLHFALGEYALAGELFKRASDALSEKSTRIESLDTSGLLSINQRQFFSDKTPRYYLHISSLFEAAKIHTYTAEFASLALQELAIDSENFDDTSLADLDTRKRSMHGSPAAIKADLALEEIRLLRIRELKEDLLGRVFSASLQTCRYKQAFDALLVFGNPVLRKASLQSLLQSLITTNSTQTLLSLPFPTHMLPEVDAILVSLARKHLAFSPTSTPGTPQYHQVIYTWRIHNGDFRGAAEILFERLQRLRHATAKVFEPDDETLLEAYLLLINTLACCGPDDGWILAEGVSGDVAHPAAAVAKPAQPPRRRVVTLEDVRREYQAELDRRSEMQQGRFALVGGGGGDDAMDVL
ncbi:hypothetical protein MBLNU459_g7002t1 [Dothideomycetes sp. NU459]